MIDKYPFSELSSDIVKKQYEIGEKLLEGEGKGSGLLGAISSDEYNVIDVARPCALFSYIVHIIRDFQQDQMENLNYFALDVLRKHGLQPADLKAIEPGHANIQQHDVRIRFGRQPDGFLDAAHFRIIGCQVTSQPGHFVITLYLLKLPEEQLPEKVVISEPAAFVIKRYCEEIVFTQPGDE